MREFVTRLDAQLTTGMSKYLYAQGDKAYSIHNAIPTDEGLVQLDSVAINTILPNGVFPQYYYTEDTVYTLMHSSGLFQVYRNDTSLHEEVIASFNRHNRFHFAEYGNYIVAVNNDILLHINKETDVCTAPRLIINSITLFQERLFFCSSFMNTINWLAPGYVQFSDLEQLQPNIIAFSNGAGFLNAGGIGTSLCLKQLGKVLMVYGSQGIGYLYFVNALSTFGYKKLYDFGVTSRDAVGGDINQHLLLTTTKRLVNIKKDLETVQIMDYRERMPESSLGISILYNSEQEIFHINFID